MYLQDEFLMCILNFCETYGNTIYTLTNRLSFLILILSTTSLSHRATPSVNGEIPPYKKEFPNTFNMVLLLLL
jgi:hypothetical protein